MCNVVMIKYQISISLPMNIVLQNIFITKKGFFLVYQMKAGTAFKVYHMNIGNYFQEGEEQVTIHPPPSQTGDGRLAEGTQTPEQERLKLSFYAGFGGSMG